MEADGAMAYHLWPMAEAKKAVALLSGGLDSALACVLTQRLGFEVVGLNLATGFCVGRGRCETVLALGHKLGIPVRLLDVAEEYLDVVLHPKYGYGSGMNPCLDCRIFMLRKAGQVMQEEGASFVVTGEVLGQRPMSQHRKALDLVATESGLGERLVRPLSGQLLGPTFPERMGWVRREDWLDLHGRSRKRQLALAQAWGLEEFHQPAGGCCILLERSYARRLKDAFRYKGKEAMKAEDFALLRHGRHFRLSPSTKVIVGRDEAENLVLESLASSRWLLTLPDVPGPVALVEGQPQPEELELAAALAARYSDAPPGEPVRVLLRRNGNIEALQVVPLAKDDPRLRKWMLGD